MSKDDMNSLNQPSSDVHSTPENSTSNSKEVVGGIVKTLLMIAGLGAICYLILMLMK